MENTDIQGALLVFGVIFYIVCYVVFQGLRARLATVPSQAALLQHQIATATAEASSDELALLRAEEELEQLRQEVERIKTKKLDAEQRLHEMQHRLPTVVYVLDQIIQSAYSPWVVAVRWDSAPKGAPDAVAAEMLRGRRVLVFADNAPNVRRRLEARFPPIQGYHIGDPAPFDM